MVLLSINDLNLTHSSILQLKEMYKEKILLSMLGDYQRIMPTMNYEYTYCKVSGQEGNGSLSLPPPPWK